MKFRTRLKAGLQGTSAFSRTMRSLEADSSRRPNLVLVVAALLLGAWFAWFFLARIARYEVTDTARLEVDQAIYSVQAPVSGRVVTSRLLLDREVQAGDILVELDSDPQRLQLAEERARVAALSPQIAALRQETTTAEQARREEQRATSVAIKQAQAQFREGEARARYAEQEAERLKSLRSEGLIAEREFTQGIAEAERRRAAAESLQFAAGRLEQEQRTRESDRQAHLDRLRGEMTQLEGQQAITVATVEKLQYEIERRCIRAPVKGRLGEVAILRTGAFVEEAAKLCGVVPLGELRMVTEFLPPAALGRIHPGQPARLRLQGFPWAQYGSIRATVASVGSEIRDGRVRVELNVHPDAYSLIPLQHGLPGTVEVEVERVSPATLVLRAAGRLVTSPRSTFEGEPGRASAGGPRMP